MNWSRLPPVGNRIVIARDNEPLKFLEETFGSRKVYAVKSGTAALAASLLAARSLLPGVENPKVLIPAYGCPNLVSAADYAGVEPVLIDLEDSRPWMSLQALDAALDESVVAVIAVALFGIRERLDELAALLENHQAFFIEDNAQYFPRGQTPTNWYGDILVYSLGRGKPASVLGGGLLITGNATLQARISMLLEQMPKQRFRRSIFTAKAATYNLLRHPLLYGLVSRLPFLDIGKTKYEALSEIAAYDDDFVAFAVRNLRDYQTNGQRGADAALYDALFTMCQRPLLTRVSCDTNDIENTPLIRFPLLARTVEDRDAAVSTLVEMGLGVSRMYGTALPDIAGIGTRFGEAARYPAARDFGNRLLTLPMHQDVAEKHVGQIVETLLAMG